jgi:intergrase/recombinase
MFDPGSAIAIVTFATGSFLNTEAGKASIGKIAEKVTESTLKKVNQLWILIYDKLHNKKLPEVDAAIVKAKQGDQAGIHELAKYLEQVMAADEVFADRIKKLNQEIQQEIQIQQASDGKIYYVFGGKVEENTFTKNQAPIIKDNTGTINISYGNTPTP